MLLLVLPMTIGTNLVFGETRFRLPLHLLRCTTCSFGPAHDNVMHAPKRTRWKSVVIRLLPPAGLSRRGLLMIGRSRLPGLVTRFAGSSDVVATLCERAPTR